ncbi:MAG: hypothetical protein ACOVMP_11160 [Chthoniobacterales bacterium]
MHIARLLLIPAAVVAGAVMLPNAVGQEPTTARLTLPMQRPGALPALIASDRIQNELRLTAEQKKAMHSLRVRHRDAVRKVVKGVDPTSLASKQAAQRSIQSITSKYNAEVLPLLNLGQRQRLTEIERQILGGHMLLSADVREKLKLTDAQKSKLAKIHSQHQADISEINGCFETGDVSNYERILYLLNERHEQAAAMEKVLTKTQRADFDAMAGQPMKF